MLQIALNADDIFDDIIEDKILCIDIYVYDSILGKKRFSIRIILRVMLVQ